MADPSRLAVLLGGEHVAWLIRGRNGLVLRYLSRTVPRISLRFDPSQLFHSGPEVRNWLCGLLPDNSEVLRAWRARLGVPVGGTNPFDLLATEAGHDCAGAVQFCLEHEIERLQSMPGCQRPLSQDELDAVVMGMYKSTRGISFAIPHRYSLGGGQTKAALRLEDGRWSVPEGAAASTHIIKPEQSRLSVDAPDMPLNEHICQSTASRMGLRAANTELRVMDGIQVLVVSRYDRWEDSSGTIRRAHQEDVCQAFGVHPGAKYEEDGGPTVEGTVSLIRRFSSDPEGDTRRYADALIFNWLVCGTDAHAKNYSFLHRGGSDGVVLAPLYDLVSSMPYELDYRTARKGRLAQKMDKAATFRDADYRGAWVRMSGILGIPEDSLVNRAVELADRAPQAMKTAVGELPANLRRKRVARDMVDMIHERSRDAKRMPLAGV